MAAEAQIKAVITADDRASDTLSKFGGVLGGVGKLGAVAAAGVAVAGAATAAFGVASVNAYMESEDAAAQLGAVLKSTGGIAGVTAQQANDLAASFQKTTKFSDEAILSGENLLLTFTAIGKDIFPQATQTMLDMSQALGQDTKSSAIQLGKALQDPILGVTALRRVGVNFSEDQQKVIKNLVETGKKAEAQKLILKELQTEFGGSAEAAGDTFGGALVRLQNTFGDLMETIGGSIAESLDPFIGTLMDFVENNGDEIQAFIFKLMDGFQALARVMFDFGVAAWPILVQVFNFLRDVGVAAVIALKQAWDFLKPSIDALWNTIQTQLWPSIVRLYEAMKPLLPILGVALVAALWLVINALNIVAKVATVWLNILSTVYNFIFNTLAPGIGNAFTWIVDKLVWLKDNFWESIGFIIGFFATLPIKLPMYMFQAIAAVVGLITKIDWGSVFKFMVDAWINGWKMMINAAMGLFNTLRNLDWGSIARSIGNGMVGLIEGAINGALNGLPGAPKIKIPRFANGVQNFGGGLAVVGERGAELVHLPKGSSVIPNHEIGGVGGTTVNITLSGVFTGTPGEARKLAQMVAENLKTVANQKNMSVAEMLG